MTASLFCFSVFFCSCTFSFRIVFFYLATTGWSFGISPLRENLTIIESGKVTGDEQIANENGGQPTRGDG